MSKLKVGQWVVGINKDYDNYNKVLQISKIDTKNNDYWYGLSNGYFYSAIDLELFSKEEETKSFCEEPSCPISEQEKFSNDVYKILSNIEKMLIEKNKKYGNSALEPIRVFSKSDNIEQIKVRIDDKLSRIRNNNINDDEDVIDDLIGYLIILKIANENN